jgi:hypothetical protein
MADAFNHRESQFCSFCGSSLRVRQLCTCHNTNVFGNERKSI